jgi:SAM-dependent methyltransferase
MEHSHAQQTPSPWIKRWAPLVRPGGVVLDLACGQGRHARLFAGRGHPVLAVDRDETALDGLRHIGGIETRVADLEGEAWPFAKQDFAAIVVANYLHRPLLSELIAALAPDGVLIYETFMQGNERYGRPSSPAFLLRPGELLECVAGHLSVVAFEQGVLEIPRPAVVQRICATRRAAPSHIL